MEKRIHVKDLPPFASSEDLSDERESPLEEDTQRSKLSNIVEEMKSPSKTNLIITNVTPRIDISRASSSSHQDDSSPEKEFVLGTAKESELEEAFGEGVITDLHSSTEELEDIEKNKKKKQSQMFSDLQTETLRKDSGCSDIVLLSISGRTSRVSSVCSVASGGSGVSNISAISHCSAVSHLSANSNLSRRSSPHRMSLETSFCGPKPMHNISLDIDDNIKPVISDKLNQKTEMKIALNVKDTDSSCKKKAYKNKTKSVAKLKHEDIKKQKRAKPSLENPKTQKFISLYSDEEDELIANRSVKDKCARPSNKPIIDSRTQIFIPLRDNQTEKICEPNPNSPKRMKPFTNTTLVNFISKYDSENNSKISDDNKSTISDYYKSGETLNEEFQRFISLKDDDYENINRNTKQLPPLTTEHYQSKSTIRPDNDNLDSYRTTSFTSTSTTRKSHEDKPAEFTKSKSDLPTYLMTSDGTTQFIPLYDSDLELKSKSNCDFSNQSNYKLEEKSTSSDGHDISYYLSTVHSPSAEALPKTSNLQIMRCQERPTRSTKSMTHLTNRDNSRTPSPNSSTFNTNNLLYRRCSESAKEIRSFEKSKTSNFGSLKSLLSVFFKRESTRNKRSRKNEINKNGSYDPKITINVLPSSQIKSKEPDTIIIPLHSPTDKIITSDVILVKNDLTTDDNEDIAINIEPNNFTKTFKNVSTNFQESNEQNELPAPVIYRENRSKIKKLNRTINSTETVTSYERDNKFEICKLECENAIEDDAADSPIENRYAYQKVAKRLRKVKQNKTLDSSDYNQNQLEREDLKNEQNKNDAEYEHLFFENKEYTKEVSNENDISTDSDKVTLITNENEENRKLVSQAESSEEELPYVPTTLPLERSVAVPIIPIKERIMNETKIISVDRPHSTTPVNLALLDNYIETSLPKTAALGDRPKDISATEKLHIVLPSGSDTTTDNLKRKTSLTREKSWQNFIETDSRSPKKHNERKHSKPSISSYEQELPAVPEAITLPPKNAVSWISFDDSFREMRQSPKRITTLPPSCTVDYGDETKISQKVIFVNPDECSCECHDQIQDKHFFKKPFQH